MVADSPVKYLGHDVEERIAWAAYSSITCATIAPRPAVAVMSPRARAGATVSMPVQWKEVRTGLDPTRYTVRTAAAILENPTPWASYADAAKSLSDAIRRVTAPATV